MQVRFPHISSKLGLGVGLDLPWGSPFGVSKDGPSVKTKRFFERYHSDYSHFFFSFQPKNRNVLTMEEYYRVYDDVVEMAEGIDTLALHHTQLNTGSPGHYQKDKLIAFTNELIRRYDLKWVNEDLGIWSIRGKRVPYPLPPIMTDAGLKACVANIEEYQAGLNAPLLVEFPGYSEGTNFFIGDYDAFDYFRQVIEQTASAATLDTGHILSYQWLMGKQDRFLEGLENLPLSHCFEIHLSGCQIVQDRFVDFHHGVLLDEQLVILDYLLEHCPNVKAITYEDPKFLENGELIPKALKNYERLQDRVEKWRVA